ncbi:peptidoglycan editing factor PgeF [Aureimonas sp. AU12]|uniref:peptidoglycan editing factor PgeF n=1 Tax=Aureimonas sp. AU12 TaxID=1638161 RepID=UPI000784C6E5|nr:peptidoglycan editing factor PgeF [Aureimonas sp. AU12]
MLDHRLESAAHIGDADVVQDERLSRTPGLRHAFFTRGGGVSTGLYAGLNAGIGSHDAPEAVHENRNRAMHFLGLTGPELATPWQVHSPDVAIVTEAFGAERPKADAVVTRTRGLAVGVVTADCGPILFADAGNGVIGAAHAGWRGALGGVLDRTIEAMESIGAERAGITAILGPCITQPNYEVAADMMAGFLSASAANERFFAPGASTDKRQFDLPGYIVARLAGLGVTAGFVGHCTYAEENRFFSFRRTTHRGEPDYGRQLSAIVLG